MTTWAQHLSDRARKWALFVRIQGIGLWLDNTDLTASGNDARIRFSIETPSHAAAQPTTLWRPYIAKPMPDLLAEEGPTYGGVATYGSVTVHLIDYNDILNSLFATESPAVTVLNEDLDLTETSVDVADAGLITTQSVIFVNDEAMRVTAIATNTLTVTRGYLGTSAAQHTSGDPVFLSTPFLLQRGLQLVVSPLDSLTSADERLMFDSFIDGVGWAENGNLWGLSASSSLKYLDRVIPFRQRSFVVASEIDADSKYVSLDNDTITDATAWAHWTGTNSSDIFPPIDGFALTDDDEIVGFAVSASRTGFFIYHRALFGTEKGEIGPGTLLKEIFVSGDPLDHMPGSFRTLAAGEEDMDIDAATRRCHFVDLMLNIMTSPQDPSGPIRQARNQTGANPNYSILPAGYGLGIPHTAIDWDSFEAVKRRTPQYVFQKFVLGGGDETSGSELFTEAFLEPMGCFLTIENGRIRLSMPNMPVVGDSAVSLGTDEFLANKVSDGTLEPRFSVEMSTSDHIGAVKYVLGDSLMGGESEITVNSSSFLGTYGRRGVYGVSKPLEFDVGGMDPDMRDMAAARGLCVLLKQSKPRMTLKGDVDIGSGWDLAFSSLAEVTLPDVPDMAGNRGWTDMPCITHRREHRFDEADGLFTSVELRSYGPRYGGRRIAGAAYVESVVTNTATVTANLYTSSDAPAATGLPTHDLEPFEIGDEVRLLNPDGTSAGGTTQTVVDVDTGTNEIELDGNFGGSLAADTIVVAANYDDSVVRQQTRFAYEADTADQTIDASSDPAVTYADE